MVFRNASHVLNTPFEAGVCVCTLLSQKQINCTYLSTFMQTNVFIIELIQSF